MAYNGWTNYETWNVALWIDNDESAQEMAQEMARSCWDDAEHGGNEYVEDRKDRASILLAEQIQNWHDEARDEWKKNGASVFDDLLNAALREVNWREVAEHYIEELDEVTAS